MFDWLSVLIAFVVPSVFLVMHWSDKRNANRIIGWQVFKARQHLDWLEDEVVQAEAGRKQFDQELLRFHLEEIARMVGGERESLG